MTTPIKSKQFITRDDVQRRRDCVFVFGDNDQRKERGGQAHACRGEPKAIGVRFKRSDADHPSAAWNDGDFEVNARKIDEDVAAIRRAVEDGVTVVFPKVGIGSGLCRLEEVAPHTGDYLRKRLSELKSIPGVVPA